MGDTNASIGLGECSSVCPLLAQSGHELVHHMSAFGGKADMGLLHCTCLLLTQSGHALLHCF